MENITITKASLSHGLFPKVSVIEHLPNSASRTHPNITCTAPAHDDLIKSFIELTPFFAHIYEEITNEELIESMAEDHDVTQGTVEEFGESVPASKAKNKKAKKGEPGVLPADLVGNIKEPRKKIDYYRCLGFEIKQKNGNEEVSLWGTKELSTGKEVGVNLPFIKLDEDYRFYSELAQVIEKNRYEFDQYLVHNKQAPSREPELEFPDGNAEGEDSHFYIPPAQKHSDDDIVDIDFDEDNKNLF